MCILENNPILYIASPSFYREVKKVEESTSIFELAPSEKIQNELIARQLHYFSRQTKGPSVLCFELTSGEKIWASINKMEGCNVHLQGYDQQIILDANEIRAIYRT